MTKPDPTLAAALAARAHDLLSRCTTCGTCFDICPMTEPAGLDALAGVAVVAGVRDLLQGGAGSEAGRRWASVCSGSGTCIPACPEGVNPRFMLTLARTAATSSQSSRERRAKGATAYRGMTRGVRVLSRLQLTPDELARFDHGRAEEDPVDVVFYTGCNILKTPHIALLCFDILEAMGVTYRVMGGPGDCCGIIQTRAGDLELAGQVAYRTTDRFADARAGRILAWCPSCQVQLGDNVLPGRRAQAPERFEFEMGSFVVWLAEHLDRLAPLMTRAVHARVGLHEHPGAAGVSAAAETILRAVPGVEFVDLAQPSVGWMCTGLSVLPAYKRDLHAGLLEAAAAAGVDTLAGVYHACHRDLCAHERDWPFEVVNFLEVVGASMGLAREDRFKRLKLMQDVQAILADVADLAALHGLSRADVEEIVARDLLGEQPLALGRPA